MARQIAKENGKRRGMENDEEYNLKITSFHLHCAIQCSAVQCTAVQYNNFITISFKDQILNSHHALRLTDNSQFHCTLMVISAPAVEGSVTSCNGPFLDYHHPDYHTAQTTVT